MFCGTLTRLFQVRAEMYCSLRELIGIEMELGQ
jgi:hypothetical protein